MTRPEQQSGGQVDVLGALSDAIAREYNAFEPNNQSDHHRHLAAARVAVVFTERALQAALKYVGQRTDGDLLALAERAELWMRESHVLIDMQRQLLAERQP